MEEFTWKIDKVLWVYTFSTAIGILFEFIPYQTLFETANLKLRSQHFETSCGNVLTSCFEKQSLSQALDISQNKMDTWIETPLIESAPLSRAAGWYGHTTTPCVETPRMQKCSKSQKQNLSQTREPAAGRQFQVARHRPLLGDTRQEAART